MKIYRVATQCKTPTGETGTFFYDSETGRKGNGVFEPHSKVFKDFYELIRWNIDNGCPYKKTSQYSLEYTN